MKLIGTLRRLLATGSTARPHIVADGTGLGIRRPRTRGGDAESRIVWDAVAEVRAYKRDLLTADLICLSVSTAAGPVLEVDEEMEEWDQLLVALPVHLPGALTRDQVLGRVTQPPFATQEMLVYARLSVFFYGLFMDPQVLERKGVRAIDPKVGRLEGYRLSIGTRATLVHDPAEAVYGILMRVSADDLRRLYSDASVRDYRPEAVRAILGDGQRVEAVCYTLPPPVEQLEPNPTYAAELYSLARRLGLPEDYLARIARAGGRHGA